MKRISLLLLAVIANVACAADTNVFPLTGSVGIGTVTPVGKLALFSVLDTRPANVDTPRLLQSWQAAGTPNYSYDTRWDLAIGNNGAYIGTGAERERNKLIFQSRTNADSWASATNALELRGDGSATFAGTVFVGGNIGSSTFIGTDIGTVGNNQVVIGGGVVRAKNSFASDGGLWVVNKGITIASDQTQVQVLTGGSFGAEIRVKNNSMTGDRWLDFGSRDNNNVYTKQTRFDPNTGQWEFLGTAPTAVGSIDGKVIVGGGRVMVGGTLSAKEIKVTTSGADYVFKSDYKLRSLAEVEQFIAEHKHLPEMMSAKAMQADGMPVSEVVTKQLAKIEELTLYAIAQKKETEAARIEAAAARVELNELKNRMERLEKALAGR